MSVQNKRPPLESKVQRGLIEGVKKLGTEAIKTDHTKGFPDRTIPWPGGVVDFVEVKREGEEPEPMQLWWHRKLRRMGHHVYVLTGKAEVDAYLEVKKNEQLRSQP